MSDFMNKWLATDEPTPATNNVIPIRPSGEGIHPYAAAIRQAWCDRLHNLKTKPWVQGDAWDTNCYATARKLAELANSPWSGYTTTEAHTDYTNHAPHNTAWDKREKCWVRGSTDAGTLTEPTPDARYEIPAVTILDVQGAEDFWDERPILTHLHTFARARRVAPWAVLGYALARAVTATHHAVVLPPIIGGYASLNLFVGIVGHSGAGKGAAGAVAREAINVGDILTLNPGSGEGIIHAYVKRTKDGLEPVADAVLFNVPEIDTLAAVGSRQGSTVMPILRSGWSGEQIGTQTADTTRRVHVADHAYRMCMVAGIQPGRAGAILDDTDGGTPQRFLWLPATDPHMPNQAPLAPAPITLNVHQQITANGFVDGRGLSAIPICDKARHTIEQAHVDRVKGNGDALDGHALLTRLKVAAALAILDNRREVTDDDWRLSRVVTRVSDATRAGIVQHRQAAQAKALTARALGEAERQVIVSETVAEKAVARIARGVLRRLHEQGDTGRAEARRQLASRDRDYFDEAVDHLKSGGQIEVQAAENNGSEGAILHVL